MKKTILFIASLLLLLIFRFILFKIYQPELKNGTKVEYPATIFNLSDKFGSQIFISKYSNNFSYVPIEITLPKNQIFFEAEKVNVIGTLNSKLIKENRVYEISHPKITKISDPIFIFSWAQIIQNKLSDLFYSNLSSTDAGLLLGIVFGTKANFSKQFQTYLTNTGVLHVIAASGMNVTMVSGFIFFLFLTTFKRQIAIIISVLFLLFYCTVSGFQPSITRALIMILFSYGGAIVGRQYNVFYGLFLAGFLMLFYDPNLIDSVSFQLSFASTLGILMFNPILPKNKFMEDFNTTLSAQLLSLPLIISNFGNYGLLSILVNILVLWTVPPLMIIGGFAAIFGLLIAPIGILFLYIARPFLWYFEHVIEYFGSFNWNLKVQSTNYYLIIGYYIFIFGVWWIFKKEKNKWENINN